jgi:hypothetical protein
MTAGLNISPADAMGSRLLFEPFFCGESWGRWHTVIKAAHGEPLTSSEERTFREVADRNPPHRKVRELFVAAGRGAGKDSIASLLATCAAINFNPGGKLRPGERAIVMCLATDREQAGIVFGYIKGLFEHVAPLRALASNFGRESIDLRNGVSIEVHVNSFRGVRGLRFCALSWTSWPFGATRILLRLMFLCRCQSWPGAHFWQHVDWHKQRLQAQWSALYQVGTALWQGRR